MNAEAYYKVRSNRSVDPPERAGEFIYLNRACFNGLYRVNSNGEFNVPYGKPRTDFVVDESNLRACQQVLAQPGVRLAERDFEDALTECRKHDFVFLDPPYVTRHNNNGFIDYNEKLFSWEDQIRLANRASSLVKKGCHVLVTNAYHSDVLSLYPEFRVHSLTRQSSLASNKSKRGSVTEALLVGGPSNG